MWFFWSSQRHMFVSATTPWEPAMFFFAVFHGARPQGDERGSWAAVFSPCGFLWIHIGILSCDYSVMNVISVCVIITTKIPKMPIAVSVFYGAYGLCFAWWYDLLCPHTTEPLCRCAPPFLFRDLSSANRAKHVGWFEQTKWPTWTNLETGRRGRNHAQIWKTTANLVVSLGFCSIRLHPWIFQAKSGQPKPGAPGGWGCWCHSHEAHGAGAWAIYVAIYRCPLVIYYIAMGNGHRNRELSHETWWFSIVIHMFTGK